MAWEYTGKETEPDSKRRVNLGAAVHSTPGIRYKVLKNELGQILLDPVKTVPAYEAWVYESPEHFAAIQKGIAQAETGQVISFDLDKCDDED